MKVQTKVRIRRSLENINLPQTLSKAYDMSITKKKFQGNQESFRKQDVH